MSAHASADKHNAGLDSPPPPSGTNCWICLDDDGRLLRNCACRGDSSGYAHVSCLAEHSRTVSDKAIAELELDIVRNAWLICPNCKQEYIDDVSLAMAEAFVEYAWHLPKDSFSDLIRFDAQAYLGGDLERSGNLGGARAVYEGMLDLDLFNPLNPSDKMAREAFVVEKLAHNYAKEGDVATDESIVSECSKKAFYYYEKAYRINVEVFGAESEDALLSEYNVAHFSDDMEASVRTARALCDVAERKYGGESSKALFGAQRLAYALQRANKLQQASELLEETIVKAQRIFGPEHPDTLDMENQLEELFGTSAAKTLPAGAAGVATIFGVTNRPDLDGEEVEVLRIAKDGNYIVRRKQRVNNSAEGNHSFKAKKANLIYAPGTKVTVMDLKKAQHLNGQTGHILSYKNDIKRYAVAVGGAFRGLIKPDNLEVAFN